MANSPLTYNPFLKTDVQQQQAQSAQQAALGQALLQEGLTPVNPNNRMVGNIAYKISPTEGLAKIAEALTGAYEQKQGTQGFYNALQGPSQQQSSPSLMQKIGNFLSPDETPAAPEQPPDVSSDMGQVQGPQQLPPIDPATAYRQQQQPQTPPQAVQQPFTPYSQFGQAVMSGDPNAIKQYGGMLLQNPDTSRAGAELLSKFAGPTEEQKNFTAAAATPGSLLAQHIQNQLGQGAMAANPGQKTFLEGQGTIAAQNSPMPTPQGVMGQAPGNMPQGNPPIPAPMSQPQIQAALPQVGQTQSPGTPTSMPAPLPGESNVQYQSRLKAAQDAASKVAETVAEGQGKADIAAATVDSRYDNAHQLISGAISAAKDASYGPLAPLMQGYHNQADDKTSVANADYENKMSQLLTQAIPGIVQSTGGRIDIPLLNAIKAAENADITLSPSAKVKVLNDLSAAIDQQRQNAHNQVSNLSGTLSPQLPMEGQTATNPQTGHKITFTNGKWQ